MIVKVSHKESNYFNFVGRVQKGSVRYSQGLVLGPRANRSGADVWQKQKQRASMKSERIFLLDLSNRSFRRLEIIAYHWKYSIMLKIIEKRHNML